MMRSLKNLLGLIAREDATADELQPSISAAESEIIAAREALAVAESAYSEGLLRVDAAALRKLADAKVDAGIRVDQATAIREDLAGKLAAAEERTVEAARVDRYQAAARQAEEARDALAEMYGPIAQQLVALIEGVARAELAVKEANADLPRGASALPPVEAVVRDVPGQPAEVLSRNEVERWVRQGWTVPDDGFAQEAVRPSRDDPSRGIIPAQGYPENACPQVELRTVIEVRTQDATGGDWAERLARAVRLPGLRYGDPDFWRDAGSAEPEAVLAAAAKLRSAESRPQPEPTVSVKLLPLAGAEPVERVEQGQGFLDRLAGRSLRSVA